MSGKPYTIQELADRSGFSRRTIRYYIQEGLLDPPAGRGRGGFYYDSHLKQLAKIRRLQARGLKLSAIAEWLRSPEMEPQSGRERPLQREMPLPGEDCRLHEMPLRSESRRRPEIPLCGTRRLRRESSLRRESRFCTESRPRAERGSRGEVGVGGEVEPQRDKGARGMGLSASEPLPEPAAQPTAAPSPIPRRLWAEFEIDDGVVLTVRSDREALRRKDIQQILRFAAFILEKEDDTHE